MSNNSQKIALFLPRPTPFYKALFFAMKQGLEQVGFEVGGWPALLECDELLKFCHEFKPQVVFEMNRSRSQIPWLPKYITHIGWIVDLLGDPPERYKDSEILYFFEEQIARKYHDLLWDELCERPKGLISWLPPGFSPTLYFHEEIKTIVDFSFVGHIPLPWNQKELDRNIGNGITFSDFYNCCKDKNNTSKFYKYGAKEISRILGKNVETKEQRLRYDINVRTHRMLNRSTMMDALLSASNSINLFGPKNWLFWKTYAPYYKKFLTNPAEIRQTILSSKVSVHEGFGPHFRLFDIMGTGRCVFYHKNPFRSFKPKEHHEMNLLFESNQHYVYFNDTDIKEKADYYLRNKEARELIGREASKLVHAKHKWSDRALKIKKDLQQIR